MRNGPLRLTPGHPRLYLTPRELPDFRRRCRGFLRPYFRRMLDKLEPAIASPQQARAAGTANAYEFALALGQAWRVTGDERYARAGRWQLEGLVDLYERGTGYDTWGVVAESAALLYDWMHDYWSREGLDESAARVALFCGRRALETVLRLYIVDDWHNYALGLQSGALAATLAVGRDHPKLERGALLETMRRFHFTGLPFDETFFQDFYRMPRTVRCLDASLRSAGGAGFALHDESTGGYHTTDALEVIKMAGWWTSAVTPDSRGRGPVWPELVRAGETILHFARPDGCMLPIGDSRPSPPRTRGALILYNLHARTPRPEFAEWLRAHGADAAGPYPGHLLLRATRESLPAQDKAPRLSPRARLPTAEFFDPVVVLRSGWDQDAACLSFRCGRHGGWHNHLDHNSFTLYRGGGLAVDAGGIVYAGEHRPEYAARTLAHNSILVRNPSEASWIGRFRKAFGNDGGQRLVMYSFNPPNEDTGGPHAILTEERRRRLRDEFEMGRVVAFRPGRKADYVAGDATRAYTYPWSGTGDNSSRRVEEFVRQVIFLKPDLIVIFDRVEATRSRFEKKWLLHTEGAPAFFRNGRRRHAARGIRRLPPEGPFEFEHERGRMTVWPLLPEGRGVRAVGGRGYECWVDHGPDGKGRNYPAPEKQPETGRWRIEISPTRLAARDTFLTVLHAGLKRQRSARGAYGFEVSRKDGAATLSIRKRKGGRWTSIATLRFREKGPVEVWIDYEGERAHHRAPAPKRVPRRTS